MIAMVNFKPTQVDTPLPFFAAPQNWDFKLIRALGRLHTKGLSACTWAKESKNMCNCGESHYHYPASAYRSDYGVGAGVGMGMGGGVGMLQFRESTTFMHNNDTSLQTIAIAWIKKRYLSVNKLHLMYKTTT